MEVMDNSPRYRLRGKEIAFQADLPYDERVVCCRTEFRERRRLLARQGHGAGLLFRVFASKETFTGDAFWGKNEMTAFPSREYIMVGRTFAEN